MGGQPDSQARNFSQARPISLNSLNNNGRARDAFLGTFQPDPPRMAPGPDVDGINRMLEGLDDMLADAATLRLLEEQEHAAAGAPPQGLLQPYQHPQQERHGGLSLQPYPRSMTPPVASTSHGQRHLPQGPGSAHASAGPGYPSPRLHPGAEQQYPQGTSMSELDSSQAMASAGSLSVPCVRALDVARLTARTRTGGGGLGGVDGFSGLSSGSPALHGAGGGGGPAQVAARLAHHSNPLPREMQEGGSWLQQQQHQQQHQQQQQQQQSGQAMAQGQAQPGAVPGWGMPPDLELHVSDAVCASGLFPSGSRNAAGAVSASATAALLQPRSGPVMRGLQAAPPSSGGAPYLPSPGLQPLPFSSGGGCSMSGGVAVGINSMAVGQQPGASPSLVRSVLRVASIPHDRPQTGGSGGPAAAAAGTVSASGALPGMDVSYGAVAMGGGVDGNGSGSGGIGVPVAPLKLRRASLVAVDQSLSGQYPRSQSQSHSQAVSQQHAAQWQQQQQQGYGAAQHPLGMAARMSGAQSGSSSNFLQAQELSNFPSPHQQQGQQQRPVMAPGAQAAAGGPSGIGIGASGSMYVAHEAQERMQHQHQHQQLLHQQQQQQPLSQRLQHIQQLTGGGSMLSQGGLPQLTSGTHSQGSLPQFRREPSPMLHQQQQQHQQQMAALQQQQQQQQQQQMVMANAAAMRPSAMAMPMDAGGMEAGGAVSGAHSGSMSHQSMGRAAGAEPQQLQAVSVGQVLGGVGGGGSMGGGPGGPAGLPGFPPATTSSGRGGGQYGAGGSTSGGFDRGIFETAGVGGIRGVGGSVGTLDGVGGAAGSGHATASYNSPTADYGGGGGGGSGDLRPSRSMSTSLAATMAAGGMDDDPMEISTSILGGGGDGSDGLHTAQTRTLPSPGSRNARGTPAAAGGGSISRAPHASAASAQAQAQAHAASQSKAAQRAAAAAAAREAAGATKAGKPRQRTRTVSTLADVVRFNLITPGPHQLLVGNQDVVDVVVHPDGRIDCQYGEFRSVSSLALKVLRQRNPNRMACDGWQEVKLNGVRLDEMRQEAGRLLAREVAAGGKAE
ncbi:hypothetical protein HYH02_011898 [Chlamydomonas schloesseri]|uniref:RAMA domain-containing protein n=1 Tax=Chlamydomonas schloesseri TaxID=2026947 RepID=A0A835SYD7_9CHLO|nr:hypothetical protein HYH02_011898 [Chlamydomonas schloesseri]|eukprot:KAG2435607.1 hypothetical protein HYH02_011898 [Chlamydomonas schloesseri]